MVSSLNIVSGKVFSFQGQCNLPTVLPVNSPRIVLSERGSSFLYSSTVGLFSSFRLRIQAGFFMASSFALTVKSKGTTDAGGDFFACFFKSFFTSFLIFFFFMHFVNSTSVLLRSSPAHQPQLPRLFKSAVPGLLDPVQRAIPTVDRLAKTQLAERANIFSQ